MAQEASLRKAPGRSFSPDLEAVVDNSPHQVNKAGRLQSHTLRF